MPWPEPSSAARSSLRRKSANARAAGSMVFRLAKSAFTPIEPKSQSGSARTSCPATSSARALFSLYATIPSPATALAVASEGRTADAGAASDCACAGADRVTVQRDRLEDATQGCAAATVRSPIMPTPGISVRSPHAAPAAPPRKRRTAGTVLLQHRQGHHLRNRVACDETDQLACRVVTATVAAEFCGISLSACSKVARQPTVRTGDAVKASATRASGPACFTD
jgi:hypothetical protein